MGQTLKSYRIRANLTQEALAERLDVTNQYISDIERGKYFPSWKFLRAFAQETKANLVALLREAGYIDEDTVALEQEIAALSVANPDFAEYLEVGKEIAEGDPDILREIVGFARWKIAEKRGNFAPGSTTRKREWREES